MVVCDILLLDSVHLYHFLNTPTTAINMITDKFYRISGISFASCVHSGVQSKSIMLIHLFHVHIMSFRVLQHFTQ